MAKVNALVHTPLSPGAEGVGEPGGGRGRGALGRLGEADCEVQLPADGRGAERVSAAWSRTSAGGELPAAVRTSRALG